MRVLALIALAATKVMILGLLDSQFETDVPT